MLITKETKDRMYRLAQLNVEVQRKTNQLALLNAEVQKETSRIAQWFDENFYDTKTLEISKKLSEIQEEKNCSRNNPKI